MKIKLFVTGGTIDAEYDPLKGEVSYGGDSHIRAMLEQGRGRADIELEELMMVDSGDMSDEQRQLILEKCRECDADRIVVTHGTDSMVQTAELMGGGRH
jgi:L-asparaginase